MATVREVAEWLVDEITENEVVYQRAAIRAIAEQFGEQFLYQNDNGHIAIARPVLAEFRKIKEDAIQWNNGEHSWRLVD